MFYMLWAMGAMSAYSLRYPPGMLGGVSMSSIRVVNLSTRQELIYTCSPEDAVIAAYAQERGDYNTWQYKERYGHLLEEGKHTFLCGDWSVMKGD